MKNLIFHLFKPCSGTTWQGSADHRLGTAALDGYTAVYDLLVYKVTRPICITLNMCASA